ncbi:Transcriptional regulator, MarR family [Olavius algarvensis associated proteobacterium Delta 3]|nr:Transcriptional regulator, MarR family [Olavius algarvensis associated proteobacterium Delta 3]
MGKQTGNISTSYNVLVALRQIIQAIDVHSKKLIKQFGLTGPQLIVLQEISRSQSITASELAKEISLSQATVTGILDRLGKRGLISRRRSENDRRRVFAKTTPAGGKMLDAAPPLMQESFTEQFNCLETWEQNMILSSLQRLVALMGARKIVAAPILATGSIENVKESVNNFPDVKEEGRKPKEA